MMALGDEAGGRPAAAMTKGGVDPCEKGKSAAGVSSNAAAVNKGGVDPRQKGNNVFAGSSSAALGRSGTRSMMTDNDVEVVTQQGKRVKLKIENSIENPWSHGDRYGSGFKCCYCVLAIKGGGASRLREHLGGIKGQVSACPNVPLNIKALMMDEKAARLARSKRNKEMRLHVEREVMEDTRGLGHLSSARIPPNEEGQLKMAMRESLREYALEQGNTSQVASGSASCSPNQQATLDRFYRSPSISTQPLDKDLARSRARAQPRVDIMMRADSREKLGKSLAKWFHANDIPGRKADCPYFRAAIKLAQQLGEGVLIPGGREIDGPYLDMNYEEMEAHMLEFRQEWDEYGVTIMCDSWTGPTMMCIINFMVFCNGRMFFHKSIDATGHVQSADFIYDCIREVVVDEIGHKAVIQIVTDNGSNYKKACRTLITQYPHITWQPCAAHTINLMLKDIGRFPEVTEVVDSAKRICRFFYNHNRLHAIMRDKIGGELIRWNATRFGTVFIFLQSFWDKMDKFKAWMVSDEWTNNEWRYEANHEFTYDCLTDRRWWKKMELVLKAVTPIYTALRYADQERNPTISGFLPRMMRVKAEIHAHENPKDDIWGRVMEVINNRLAYLLNDTLIIAAAALDPEALYRSNIGKKTSSRFAVTMALKKIASSSLEASRAIDQYNFFIAKKGLIGGDEARRSALNGSMTAVSWWDSYGGEYKELQKLARRLVSQCLSSSGCERNWSTFALVHTKVRNKLGYEKLHKLVYVHYNLKLRIQHFQNDVQLIDDMNSSQERDSDPYSIMIDVAMYDEGNPIMDWLCNSMSESVPTLDEFDDNEPELSSPSRFLIDELEMNNEDVALFKRKLHFRTSGAKNKKKARLEDVEEDSAEDIVSDSPQGSPTYAESGDSTSNDGDSNGDDDVGVHAGGKEDHAEPSARGASIDARYEQPAPLRPKSARQRKVSVKVLLDKISKEK